jgi:hypothetical protein
MSRIPTLVAIEPPASRRPLQGVNKQPAFVPNLFRLVANSRAALEGACGLRLSEPASRDDQS